MILFGIVSVEKIAKRLKKASSEKNPLPHIYIEWDDVFRLFDG